MVLWSPLRSTLTTPEVSTTNAETGHPLAAQASTAAVAASTASASGSEYPDCATCAAAKYGRTIEAHALRVIATAADFMVLGRGLINAQPQPNGRKLDECEVVSRKLVVAGCHTPT